MHPEIFSDESHEEFISAVRTQIGPTISSLVTDHDCLRFLRARQGDVTQATAMLRRWHEWRHTLLEPSTPTGLPYSPNIILFAPDVVETHPQAYLLECAHYGFGRNGEPIYWEKTGKIQSQFSEIRQYFTKTQLLHYHISSNEVMAIRMAYATATYQRPVHQAIVIFDMKGLTFHLHRDTIWYVQQMLTVDNHFYPERLAHMVIINCPWYFSTLYNLFQPLIDTRTKQKITILGDNYLSTLLVYMDMDHIPTEYGGTGVEVGWDWKYQDNTGASVAQIGAYMENRWGVRVGLVCFIEL